MVVTRTGITRARFEQIAHERGFTVEESHLNIYYSSLDKHIDETFLTVMDGMYHVVQFNAGLLEWWIPESYVTRELDAYKAPEPAERFSLRLPDGQVVEWTVQEIMSYQVDWKAELATIPEYELEQGMARLKGCLAHDDGAKCPVCSGDDQ